MKFHIEVTGEKHCAYADEICREMEESAKVRGTGIAKRSSDYVRKKMCEGKAVIALDEENRFAGFSYIESWSHYCFVANSGLIVNPQYRKSGLARQIKKKIFELSRKIFPNAKIFSITTSLAVMKLNSEIGYKPVTFSELTDDEEFWRGCESCVNYDILQRNNRRMCLCTGMLYDPNKDEKFNFIKKMNVLERFRRLTTAKEGTNPKDSNIYR